MSGNVSEWCQDRWGYYSSSSQTNPIGANSESLRVRRGGYWGDYAGCRSSCRFSTALGRRFMTLGLRLILSE